MESEQEFNVSGYQEFCELWRTIRMNVLAYESLAWWQSFAEKMVTYIIALSVGGATTGEVFKLFGEEIRHVILVVAALFSIGRAAWPASTNLATYQRLSFGYRELDNRALRFHADIKHARRYGLEEAQRFRDLMERFHELEMTQPPTPPWWLFLSRHRTAALDQLSEEFLTRGLA